MALLIASVLIGIFSLQAFADESIQVYVTVSDGNLAVARQSITVTDADNDGSLTINDALLLAHEAFYDGGADAGYASVKSEWGLSIQKLWGIENGGSYGYYVNNAPAFGLTDLIQAGDVIDAFVYADAAGYSDVYCYFELGAVDAVAGETLELTLTAAGYDENWMPITLPVAGAEITVDGALTGVRTDENGEAVIVLDKAGTVVISAKSDSQLLVPPVCVASVTESAPQTGDNYLMIVAAASAAVVSMVIIWRKKAYEE